MAYSLELCERLRDAVDLMPRMTEKKMFGGIVYLYQGNMLAGIWKDHLILRLGAEQASAALKQKHVKVFDITGKPMKNWVMIHENRVVGEAALKSWLQKAHDFVGTLPPK